MWAELVGLSLSHTPHQAFYIPLAHRHLGATQQLPLAQVLKELKPILEDPEIKKVGQNLKYEWIVLKRLGIQLRGILCDTMIASYLLNPTKHNHNLGEIAREYLDLSMTDYKEVVGTGGKAVTFDQIDFERARDYSCADAEVTLQLSRLLLPKLGEGGSRDLFDQVELPLLVVLAKMEMHGVKIDTQLLHQCSKEVEAQLQQKVERIYELAGESFNINSSQQLGKILFEKLGLPALKKTKTGYSTDGEVLTKLALQHELPSEVLSYRNLTKLKSTYIDALPKLVHPETGRVHTSYNQTVTATGRLSSSDPNLQNIPIRTEEGNRIRQSFIPERGWQIISADYSQIELRILAHLSQDERLLEAFREDEDIHARTASEVFSVPREQVTSQMRREAKVINFGILYGMSAYGLAQQLGVEPKVAQAYIDEYFKKYNGVQAYIENGLAEVRQKGYVTTLLNRRRYLSDIHSPTVAIRQASERMAINTPLQGTAADIIKVAMIHIQNRIEESGLSTRMIMQVHDELVFEAPEDELQQALSLIRAGDGDGHEPLRPPEGLPSFGKELGRGPLIPSNGSELGGRQIFRPESFLRTGSSEVRSFYQKRIAMKKLGLFLCLLFVFSLSPVKGQEIYRWVDEKGTIHYADDLTLVPERYREHVQKRKPQQESSPSPSIPPSPGPPGTEARPSSEPSSDRRDLVGRDEQWWRAKVKEWEDKFQNAQNNYDKTYQAWKSKEKELEDSKFKPDSLKRKIRAEIKDLEEKTKALEKEVNEAREMLEKVLPREAEENRADPDWLKPKEQKEPGESLPGPGTPPDSTINK